MTADVVTASLAFAIGWTGAHLYLDGWDISCASVGMLCGFVLGYWLHCLERERRRAQGWRRS